MDGDDVGLEVAVPDGVFDGDVVVPVGVDVGGVARASATIRLIAAKSGRTTEILSGVNASERTEAFCTFSTRSAQSDRAPTGMSVLTTIATGSAINYRRRPRSFNAEDFAFVRLGGVRFAAMGA